MFYIFRVYKHDTFDHASSDSRIFKRHHYPSHKNRLIVLMNINTKTSLTGQENN